MMYEFLIGCLIGGPCGALTVAWVRWMFPMPQPSETWMRVVRNNDQRIAAIERKIRHAEANEVIGELESAIRQLNPECPSP